MVVEHKHKIGFAGTLLIEPKPMEPTKHQYDHDAAAVHAFLLQFGLEREIKLNIEANHATLAGHSFQHELAYAVANDLFGSVDVNRGDPQNGWDTDQFPNSADELTLALYTILRGGGFTTGGFNFDAKLRRQSIAPDDLLHAHVGGMDTLARALLRAAQLIEGGDARRASSPSATPAGTASSAAPSSPGSARSADLERYVLVARRPSRAPRSRPAGDARERRSVKPADARLSAAEHACSEAGCCAAAGAARLNAWLARGLPRAVSRCALSVRTNTPVR